MIRFQNLKALASIRERDAQQAKQQFDILLREGIRKRFGQYFDDAHRSVLEEELYVIGVRGAESLFLHYLDTLKKIRRFAFPYVCGTENASLICYCLGITQVDPVTTHSRFEQFLPPDDDWLPALHIELPGNQKEEAWRRFGVGGRFGWIYQRKRAFEVSVQQAERFFMRPSFKDPPSLQLSSRTMCLRSRCRKRLRNMCVFVRRNAAEGPEKRCCFGRMSSNCFMLRGIPMRGQNGCGGIAHRVRRRQSGGNGRSSAALPVNGVCGTIRRCTYLKPSSAQADSPSLAPA